MFLMKVTGLARLKDGSVSGSALPSPVKEGWLNFTLILIICPFLIFRLNLNLGGLIFSAMFFAVFEDDSFRLLSFQLKLIVFKLMRSSSSLEMGELLRM